MKISNKKIDKPQCRKSRIALRRKEAFGMTNALINNADAEQYL
jgi:hypothetical protein